MCPGGREKLGLVLLNQSAWRNQVAEPGGVAFPEVFVVSVTGETVCCHRAQVCDYLGSAPVAEER